MAGDEGELLSWSKTPGTDGVSMDFFTGVIRLLLKIHGNRKMGRTMNCLHPNLKEIEQAYLKLEVSEPKRKRKR